MREIARFPSLACAVALAIVGVAGCGEVPRGPLAAPSQSMAAGAPDPFALSVGQGRPTVIEFGASACASCRDMKVVLEALRNSHGSQIGIAEIDLIKQREAIPHYRIQVMPTQVFFDAQGREVSRHFGVIDAAGILARLDAPALAK